MRGTPPDQSDCLSCCIFMACRRRAAATAGDEPLQATPDWAQGKHCLKALSCGGGVSGRMQASGGRRPHCHPVVTRADGWLPCCASRLRTATPPLPPAGHGVCNSATAGLRQAWDNYAEAIPGVAVSQSGRQGKPTPQGMMPGRGADLPAVVGQQQPGCCGLLARASGRPVTAGDRRRVAQGGRRTLPLRVLPRSAVAVIREPSSYSCPAVPAGRRVAVPLISGISGTPGNRGRQLQAHRLAVDELDMAAACRHDVVDGIAQQVGAEQYCCNPRHP